ncbi:MAG: O-antigen ligase family protein [Geminicoccaceae bacterium]
MAITTDGPEPRTAQPFGINDYYLGLLLFGLLGYSLFGRGFAYLGLPPLFIGEFLLVLGLIALLNSGASVATLSSVAGLWLIMLMVWTLARTAPYIGEYGVDALRDSVIALYGLYAFVMAGLLLERPDRLRRLIEAYGRFTYLFIPAVLILYPLQQITPDVIPTWPITGVPLVVLKPGDIGVHLAGISLFLLLGFRRLGVIWLILLLAAMAMAATQGRGGMLAMVLPIALALVLVRANRPLIFIGVLTASAVILALVLDLKLEFGDRRVLSARQFVTNVISILSSTRSGDLDDTKEWRLEWWGMIVDYTLNGRYFWTGKGFGVNLANSDGFQVIEPGQGALLRSPHNATMTILARGGAPGLVFWLMTCAVWGWTMFSTYRLALAHQNRVWSRFFLFIFCYWLSAMINATFDVSLEGPMMGIWAWCLFGVGMAAAMLYRVELAGSQGEALALRATGRRTVPMSRKPIISSQR